MCYVHLWCRFYYRLQLYYLALNPSDWDYTLGLTLLKANESSSCIDDRDGLKYRNWRLTISQVYHLCHHTSCTPYMEILWLVSTITRPDPSLKLKTYSLQIAKYLRLKLGNTFLTNWETFYKCICVFVQDGQMYLYFANITTLCSLIICNAVFIFLKCCSFYKRID